MYKTDDSTIFYGWAVVLGCFLLTLSFGHSFTFAIFFTELEDEFQWSATVTGSIPQVAIGATTAMMLFGGWIVDKYGSRNILLLATLLVGPSITLLSQSDSLWYFYLLYAVSAIGGGLVASIPTSVVQKWFVEKRGLALGLVTAGMGGGRFIYAPLAGWLIETYSWQTAYVVLGVATTIFLLIAVFIIVDSPARKGLTPYGGNKHPQEQAVSDIRNRNNMCEWSVKRATRTWAFPTICAYFFLMILAGGLIDTHLVRFATEEGITTTQIASWTLGITGGISILGRIGFGAITPTIMGWKQGLVLCSLICAGMLLWLRETDSIWMLFVFSIVYGFFQGARVPLIPGIIGTYYGTKSLASLIAIAMTACMLGAAVGISLGNIISDRTGSYSWAFVIGAICCIMGAILALTLKPPQAREDTP